jgi:hypothetical protein
MNEALGKIHRLLHSRGLQSEIWLDETGDRNLDERAQSIQIIKSLIHAASTGVKRVHLHGLWDFEKDSQWGILKNTPSEEKPVTKESYDVFKTFINKIGNNLGVTFLGTGHYLVFLPEGRSVYILWSENIDCGSINLFPSKIKVTDIDNQDKIINGLELKLTSEPVFVEIIDNIK